MRSTVADLYRKRWTLETAFQELEASLNGEINTLGYPKAALFAFCVALVAYNVLSAVKAALRSVHGDGGGRRRGLGLRPGRGGGRAPTGDDDRGPEGRVGGVPWDVAAGDQPVPEAIWPAPSGCRNSASNPEAPRNPAPSGRAGQDQTCGTAKLLTQKPNHQRIKNSAQISSTQATHPTGKRDPCPLRMAYVPRSSPTTGSRQVELKTWEQIEPWYQKLMDEPIDSAGGPGAAG